MGPDECKGHILEKFSDIQLCKFCSYAEDEDGRTGYYDIGLDMFIPDC